MNIEILQRTVQDGASTLISHWNKRTSEERGIAYEIFDETDGPFEEVLDEMIARLDAKDEGALLYLDPRALLYPSGLSPAFVCDSLLGSKDVAVSVDVGGETARWNPGGYNAGQVLFRRGPAAVGFVNDWRTFYAKDKTGGRLRGQNAMRKAIEKNLAAVSVVRDYWRFAARNGYFVRNYYVDPEAAVIAEVEAIFGALEPAAPAVEEKPKKKKTSTKDKKEVAKSATPASDQREREITSRAVARARSGAVAASVKTIIEIVKGLLGIAVLIAALAAFRADRTEQVESAAARMALMRFVAETQTGGEYNQGK